MSLLRRLLVSVSVALLVISMGTLVFSWSSARQYLAEQLDAQASNAAVSLALSLSQPGNQDPVVQELLVAALFDTGKFQSIQMVPAGQEAQRIERTQQASTAPDQAPAWFTKWMPMPHAQAERAVSNGWNQLGTVSITVDSQFAQSMLWRSSLKMLAWTLIAGAIWAVFVAVLLRWFKRVLLEEIQGQVLQIGQSDAVQSTPSLKPSVAELQSVSRAIADTRVRVQQKAQAQEERIESLELEAHSDAVTGMPNRKFFMHELHKILQAPAVKQVQLVLLCRARDLQWMNSKLSREAVDQWLRDISQQVQQLLHEQAQPHGQWSRLNGSDFAVVVLADSSMQAFALVEQIRMRLHSLRIALGDGAWSRWAMAMTDCAQSDTASTVMQRLGQGIMQIESNGSDEAVLVESSEGQSFGGDTLWQNRLSQALTQPQAIEIVVSQSTYVSQQGVQTVHEASMQLRLEDGKVLAAGLFLPAVTRMGMSADYDLRAIEQALHWLAQHAGQRLVVRVSMASLEPHHFLARVEQVLQASPAGCPALVIEVDAYALTTQPEAMMALHDLLESRQAGLALRGLERALWALLHVPQMRLQYVKLSGYFAEQARSNRGIGHLLEAILAATQEAGCAVWVTEHVDVAAREVLLRQGLSLRE